MSMSLRTPFVPAIRKLVALHKTLKSRKDVPGDVISAISDVIGLADKQENYVESMTSEESQELEENRKSTFNHPWQQLYEEGKTNWNINPSMATDRREVQFMKSLIAGSKAKRVLEIGLFTGYGAMAMAEALPPDGAVVSLEIDPYLVKLTRSKTEGTRYAKQIQIMEGPALESMEKLLQDDQQFDVVYVDADEDNYPNYYEMLMDKGLLAKGGVMLFDNALFRGTAYSGEIREGTEAVIKTNEMIRNDDRVHKVMLKFKDGLYMVRRKEDFGIC